MLEHTHKDKLVYLYINTKNTITRVVSIGTTEAISKHCYINCQMNPFKCKHVFFRTLFFNRISLIVMAKRIRKLKWNKANYKELVNFKMPVFSNNVKRQKKMNFTQQTF